MYTFSSKRCTQVSVQLNRIPIISFHFVHTDLLPNHLLIFTFEHFLALTMPQAFIPSNPKPSVLNISAADNPKPGSCWLGGFQQNWAGRDLFKKSQNLEDMRLALWENTVLAHVLVFFSPRTSQRVEKLQQEFHYQPML